RSKGRAKYRERLGPQDGEFPGHSLLLPIDGRPISVVVHARGNWARLRPRVMQVTAKRGEGSVEVEAIGQHPVCRLAGLFYPATPAEDEREGVSDDLDKLTSAV